MIGLRIHIKCAISFFLDSQDYFLKLLGQLSDKVLFDTANILKANFRKSDIIARIGGYEFVVLAIETREDASKILTERLEGCCEIYNVKEVSVRLVKKRGEEE